MFKIAFQKVFVHFNANLRKNEGFLTSIPWLSFSEYSQLNVP